MSRATSQDIWGAFFASNWQGPCVVAILGAVAAMTEHDNPLLGALGAGLGAVLFSHAVSLLIGVPILYGLRQIGMLKSWLIIGAAGLCGAAIAVAFVVDSPVVWIYPVASVVCGLCAGVGAARYLRKAHDT